MTYACYLSYNWLYPIQGLLWQPQNNYLILFMTVAVPYPWTDFVRLLVLANIAQTTNACWQQTANQRMVVIDGKSVLDRNP
jgi:hypothetical protein